MGVNLGSAYGEIVIGTGEATQSVQSLSQQLGSVGRTMSLAISAPLIAVGAAAIHSAGGFEQSLNIMGQVSGATGAQMDALRDQALQLGADTSFSAGEAAEAMLELAKAGMTAEQAGAAVGGVMDLAAAGGLGLSDAATITANAINSFGLDASASADVANTFAAAANASSAEVGDLAAGFQNAGAVFATTGQGVDDLAASLAIMSNNGVSGAEAGTQLKTMMMRLTAPTDEAKGVMDSLGISVFDAAGKMRPFGDIVGQLEGATKGMSDAQRQAAMQTMFGSFAINAATILAREGVGAFDAMKVSVTEQGAAADVAGARMSGFRGALEVMKGAVESFLIDAAMPFLGVMGGILRQVANAITSFGGLPQPVRDAALAFAAVLAAAGPLMLAIGGVVAVVGALTSPIGLVVLAVAGLAAAWAGNWGGIREKTAAAWAAIQPLLAAAVTWFRANLPAALTALQASFATAWSGAGATVSAMWGAVQPSLAQMATWFTASLPGALTTARGSFTTAITAIQTIWQTLVGLFGPSIQRIQTAFLGLGTSTAPLLPALQGLGTAFQTFWAAVQPVITAIGQVIGASIGVVALTAMNGLATAIGAIGPILTTLVSQVTAAVQLIATTIGGLVAIVQAIVAGDWTAAWGAAGEVADGFATFVSDTLQNLLDFATTVFTGLYDIVYNTLSDLGVDMEAVMSGIVTWWQQKWAALVGFVQPVLDIVGNLQKKLEDFISWIGGISIPNPFAGWSMPEMPAWARGLLPGNASGTSWSLGGLTEVGERGREFIIPPTGSKVLTHGQSNRLAMAGAGGDGMTTINMGPVNIYDKTDIEALAYRVATINARRRR